MALAKATSRLTRELSEMKADPREGIRITPTENLFVWKVVISGPCDTAYQGGNFPFTFTFPINYPLQPPKVKRDVKVFHCNINLLGDVCLNILKEDWTCLNTVAGIALGLQQLFLEPNPYSPLDPEVGTMFVFQPSEYKRRARMYTKKFAM